MNETGVLILLIAVVAAFILFDTYDRTLLRLTGRIAARFGAWFGADCLPLARKGNAIGRPLAMIGTAALAVGAFARGDQFGGWIYAVIGGLWVLTRWFSYEPKLITQTEKERESFSAVLTMTLWSEQRTNRRMAVVLAMLWVPIGHQHAAFEIVGEWTAFVAILCSLSVAYLISIEQPPYEHVKLRDRLRVMFARPAGGEA